MGRPCKDLAGQVFGYWTVLCEKVLEVDAHYGMFVVFVELRNLFCLVH